MHRHGSPFDRGHADFYYGREFEPHFYSGDTYQSTRIQIHDMTVEQIEQYKAGWENARLNGDEKDWD